MPRKNRWDGDIEEVLADVSGQRSEIETAYKLMDTARNGGKVPLSVLEDVIKRLDTKNHAAADEYRVEHATKAVPPEVIVEMLLHGLKLFIVIK